MEIHPAAMADWVPDFVRVNNKISGIDRASTPEEVAAHRGLFATNALRVENIEIFVDHIERGARIRDDVEVGIFDNGLAFQVDPTADLATIVTAIRTFAAPPERLHRLYRLLHPFTEGNGRSGRALLMWQVIRRDRSGRGSATARFGVTPTHHLH
jgi:hypothetical protein